MHGQEEGIAGMNPAGTVGREATGRDDTVDVGMSTPTPTVP